MTDPNNPPLTASQNPVAAPPEACFSPEASETITNVRNSPPAITELGQGANNPTNSQSHTDAEISEAVDVAIRTAPPKIISMFVEIGKGIAKHFKAACTTPKDFVTHVFTAASRCSNILHGGPLIKKFVSMISNFISNVREQNQTTSPAAQPASQPRNFAEREDSRRAGQDQGNSR